MTYLYTRFERVWHWASSGLLLILMLSGFQIRFSSIRTMSFEHLAHIHETAAFLFIGLSIFAMFWHLTTDAWKQYRLEIKGTKEVCLHYARGLPGLFPLQKDRTHKFNPLQRWIYGGYALGLLPVLLGTGLGLGINSHQASLLEWPPLKPLLLWVHVFSAYVLVSFVMGHVYLSVFCDPQRKDLKAMISGWMDTQESGQDVRPT